MKLFILFLFMSVSHAASAQQVTLEISKMRDFLTAFDGAYMQHGQIVDMMRVDAGAPSCQALAGGATPSNTMTSDLVFSTSQDPWGGWHNADFRFESPDRKFWVELSCTSRRSLDLAGVSEAMGSIAVLK
jgi:hypothetical protein